MADEGPLLETSNLFLSLTVGSELNFCSLLIHTCSRTLAHPKYRTDPNMNRITQIESKYVRFLYNLDPLTVRSIIERILNAS